MSDRNAALRRELENLGDRHDAETAVHDQRLLNITPETGAFLAVLVRACRAQRILEIGTSNGYSTLWLAEAAHATGGEVTTVEHRPAKAALARATFGRAATISAIHLKEGDGGDVLATAAVGAYDFIFLDADRSRYAAGGGAYAGRSRTAPCSSLITRCRTPRKSPRRRGSWRRRRVHVRTGANREGLSSSPAKTAFDAPSPSSGSSGDVGEGARNKAGSRGLPAERDSAMPPRSPSQLLGFRGPIHVDDALNVARPKNKRRSRDGSGDVGGRREIDELGRPQRRPRRCRGS